MAYRLSMAPRIARRFGVHARPHVVRLVAHLARRTGWVCLVVGLLAATFPSGTAATVAVRPRGETAAGLDGMVVEPSVPHGVQVLDAAGGRWDQLVMEPTSWLERSLAHGRGALLWLCVGAAALWLAPLLRSFAAGEPFAAGNARRLRGIAAAVLVGGHLAPWLPVLAATVALHRLGMTDGFAPAWDFPVHTSLLVVLLLLLLAGALTEGRRLQLDSEGLV